MMRFILYNLIVFTLLSCGNSQSQFRLTGEFKHLQQGEFYLYNPETEEFAFDTISISGGKFDFQTSIKDNNKAIYYLLYPNFTEQVIFAQNGTHVEIKGDARKLSETEVSGTDENKQLTLFRKKHLNSSTEEQKADAAQYIKNNAGSIVSLYLFQKYFLNTASVDTLRMQELYETLLAHQPNTAQIKKWQTSITALTQNANINVFKQIKFITSEKDTVTTESYKGKPILITFWASWLSSSYQNYQTKNLWTKYQDSLQILSISLDISEQDLTYGIKRNNIKWPIYCDYNGWENPIYEQLSIHEIPFALLFDKEQKFVISGKDIKNDITPALKKLIHIEE